jgi:hypothetical protein
MHGTDAGTRLDDVKPGPREQVFVALQRKVLVVMRIPMVMVEKRRPRKHHPARLQNAEHFPDRLMRLVQVFDHSLTINGMDTAVGIRQFVRVGHHVHVGKWADIDICKVACAARPTTDGQAHDLAGLTGQNFLRSVNRSLCPVIPDLRFPASVRQETQQPFERGTVNRLAVDVFGGHTRAVPRILSHGFFVGQQHRNRAIQQRVTVAAIRRDQPCSGVLDDEGLPGLRADQRPGLNLGRDSLHGNNCTCSPR